MYDDYKPKYPASPELYEEGDGPESEDARDWFRSYGYEYGASKDANAGAMIEIAAAAKE